MATTVSPININKLLGLDESLNELDPTMLQMLGGPTARGGKPDLDDALNNEYFKRTGIRLAPGQLPEPVPEGEEARQAGKTWLRKQGERVTNLIPSFGSGAGVEAPPTEPSPYLSKRTRQDELGAPGADVPIIRDPLAQRAPVTDPLAGTPLAPTATSPIPPAEPAGTAPSPIYSTLQKHAAFVRDVAEGGGALIAGVGAFGYGALTAGSEVLNDWLTRVAKEGPLAGGPESPTYYRDVFKRMDKRIADIAYEPKSDIAKNMVKGVGKALGLVKDVADLAGTASTYVGFNEDQAKVLSFAAEMYLLYKLDSGVRSAAPELRAKIADYKAKATRGSDAEMAGAAQDLADAAARNPNLDGAMNEARGKFRDEGEAAAARGPVGPEPGGPAPAGTYYDPADIAAYTTRAQDFAAQFRRDNPNASIRDVRDALDTLPKPEPKPVPEAPQRPEASRAPEAPITPTEVPRAPEPPLRPEDIPPGEMVVRPRVEPEAPIAPEPAPVVPAPAAAVTPPEVSPPSSGDLSVAAAVPPQATVPGQQYGSSESIRTEISNTLAGYEGIARIIDNRLRRGETDLAGAARLASERIGIPIEQGMRVAELSAELIRRDREGSLATRTQAAATVPTEAPAAALAVAATPPEVAAVTPVSPTESVVGRTPRVPTRQEIVNNALGIIRDNSSSPAEIRQVLSIIKREAHLESPEDIIGGLNKLGIDNATIDNLFPEFREARERIRSTPEPTRPAASSEPRVITDFDILPPEAPLAAAPVAAATISTTPEFAEAARGFYDLANASTTPSALRRESLRDLKTLARDAAEGANLRLGLQRLGFTPDEIIPLEKDLKSLRARKSTDETLARIAKTPAAQTAAAESALADAPPGTEVEIPAPTTPVVDTSPAIEKPKRKRRVVKAPSAEQIVRNQYAEDVVTEMRGQREQRVNQRAAIQAELNIPLAEAGPILERAFKAGIRPNDAANELVARGVPLEGAQRAAGIAYDLFVRDQPIAESPVTGTGPVAEVAATAGVETGAAPASSVRRPVRTPEELAALRGETAPTPAGDARYYTPANLDDLGATARVGKMEGEPLPSAEPARSPIQLRFPASQLRREGFGSAIQGAKPDAVFVDTSGINTRTSLADIEKQLASGRMSADVGAMMKANLQRQADLAFLDITEAHTFTGQELLQDATRIAAETGIDLYVKKGKNYELVPKDVVKMDARINSGDDLKPVGVSKESAGAYVESKTSDIGPDAVAAIREAVELGIDISNELPAELLPHYRAMVEQQRAGMDTSERRSDIDIAVDREILLDEINRFKGEGRGTRGPLSGESGFIDISAISDAAKMAAQRLQADMRKLGKGVREFLFGARPEDVAVFEKYLARINNPAPPDSTNPANMRFDPENVIPGDRILKQRITEAKLPAPPLWKSEVEALQNAKDIKPGGSTISLKTPYWQHLKADTQFIYYSYRTAQKNIDAAIADIHDGMQELGRGFSTKSLENIGANGYQRQGPDGQRILTYNKVKPTPLSPAEKRLQANIDGIYADLWIRVNEERVATGREALPAIDDYQTFARTQSLLNHLNMGSNLIMDKAADIMAKYMQHKSTNFPYTALRQGAVYSAEMNALKILDTYAQSALKEIFLGPFLGKLHELIEYKLPDPTTGAETWLLKDEKPGLYKELSRWKDYLATGQNLDLPELARYWLGIANRNLGYAMLSFGLRSGAVQFSTLRNTYQSLGMVPTVKGLVNHLMDIVSGGKKFDFALENSEVLASRKFIDAYSDTAAAIVGRRPRDFFRAVARGQVGEIQAAIGGVGMKVLEIPDMQAAVMSWNAAYDQARSRSMGYNHKDAKRFADDLVVRSQGSTMPGDLAGIQRNAVGKSLTQFQTFAISDWNFLTNEVFSKQQGKISNLKMVGNIIKYAVATQLMNEFYRMLHIQPPGIELVRDWAKGFGPGISNFIEPIPILSSTRYGRSVAGPLVETGRDFSRALREDPMAPSPFEPGSMLLGAPGVRTMSKYIRGKKRGETEIDSLLGWYSEDTGGGRRRPERRARSSR